MSQLSIADIVSAKRRISRFITHTPIIQSSLLNTWMGHQIFFKAECLQRTGAFKLRGACHVLAKLAESGQLPKKVVANSSGNHAQAVAYAANIFDVPATIYTAKTVSQVKAAATQWYGAELQQCDNRKIVDQMVADAAEEEGTLWIPPFNNPDIIAGQGTVAYDSLNEIGEVDGIFAPCGGGGLLSGTLIASRALSPGAEVIGAEPLVANDAAQSLQKGTIQTLSDTPDTLADGAATLSVGELTFPYLKHLDDFYEVEEVQIAYWTQWLQHLLKMHVEPTCAMSMAAVAAWLGTKDTPQKVLVILSGGNIDAAKMRLIWQENYLEQLPILNP